MKKCAKCGFENETDAQYCMQCGCNLGSQQPIKTKKSNRIFIVIGTVIVIALVVLNQLGYIGEDKTSYLIASQKQIAFLKPGGTINIDIDTDGRRWKITHYPDWCTVEKDGMHFSLTCDKNTSTENREGWITVTSGKFNLQLVVEQYGEATYVKLSETELRVSKDGESFNINYETDGDTVDVYYPDYCSETDNSGGFSIRFNANDDYARTGTISVETDDVAQKITFYQEGKCSQCGGTGQIDCPYCFGSGRITAGYDMYANPIQQSCSNCNGTGKIECSNCNGTGVH